MLLQTGCRYVNRCTLPPTEPPCAHPDVPLYVPLAGELDLLEHLPHLGELLRQHIPLHHLFPLQAAQVPVRLVLVLQPVHNVLTTHNALLFMY